MRLLASNRRVDVISEGFDVAIRVRSKLDSDATLVLRSFGPSRVLLVASPAFLAAQARPRQPADLEHLPLLSMLEHEGAQVVELLDADANKAQVEMQARVACGEFAVLHEAARRGVGIAMLPEFVCAPAITAGELEVVLPAWSVPQGTMHFVYPSRRGQLPGVRAFVEFLAERLPGAVQLKHEQCSRRPPLDAAAR